VGVAIFRAREREAKKERGRAKRNKHETSKDIERGRKKEPKVTRQGETKGLK
jgi:hypothetical protein